MANRGVMISLLFLGVLCFLQRNLHAANHPRTLDIRVQPQGFGAASADIAAVLDSAASEIWRYCPQTHLDAIDIYCRNDHPQTDFKRNAGGRISIGLTA